MPGFVSVKKRKEREAAHYGEAGKRSKPRERETVSDEITIIEAQRMNVACTEWLRKRGLLYDHEAIKNFMFE